VSQPSTSRYARSAALHAQAQTLLPRGVTRAASADYPPVPLRFASGQGSRITDVDGNSYIDYALGTTVLVLGHRPRRVVDSVRRVVDDGVLFAGSHEAEIELARRVTDIVPHIEKVSFHNSSSEAIHVALGIARLLTGRRRVVKFEGHMNGWIAPMPVNIESSEVFDGTPSGIPGWEPSEDVSVAIWNDIDSVARLFDSGEPVAALILEPVMINAGVVPPKDGFLQSLRELCDAHGVLLIFDETLTGFRVALGGAQELFGVRADLVVMGKALSNGFPIAMLGASRGIWDEASERGLRIRGTNNAHAVPVAAALGATEEFQVNAGEIYPRLYSLGERLRKGLQEAGAAAGKPIQIAQFGPVLSATWGLDAVPQTYRDIRRNQPAHMMHLGLALMERGIYTMRASRWFISAAHTTDDIDAAISATADSLTQA
jgi:glutamate-1-semialdehyde 2,1-aminomutase